MQAVRSLVTDHPYLVAAAGASLASWAVWYTSRSTDQSPPRPPPGPRDTVMLYGLGEPDVPSLSPYAFKLEVYMRLAKIPYIASKELHFSSKGKVPWISYNGQEISDSQFCIEFLQKQFGVDLNQGLSPEQKAVAHAFRLMMDEFHFWLNAHFRLYDEDDPILVKFVPDRAGRQNLRSRYKGYLHAQGVGRHSEEEIAKLFTDNLKTLEVYLGDKLFLMGDTPTEVDCAVFAFLAMIIFYPSQQLQRKYGQDYVKKSFPKLYEYAMRMKARTYPDYKM